MTSKKKTLGLIVAAVLLVVGSVMGTMAYLMQEKTVTNEFTVGNINMTLDESQIDNDGMTVVKGDDSKAVRADEGQQYKLIPGHTYTKDPIIHIAEGSEPCYVFVKVENGLANGIESKEITADPSKGVVAYETIAQQMATNGWSLVSGTTNVYCKDNPVDAANAQVDVDVFGEFKVADDANLDNVNNETTINVIAYAVQKDGFDSPAAAWNATFGK